MGEYRGNIEIIQRSDAIILLPFCSSIKDEEMRLVQFVNTSEINKQLIIVEKVDMRFGIPPKGFFYCVMCKDAFVKAVPMIGNSIDKTIIRDGFKSYEFGISDDHNVVDYCEKEDKEESVFKGFIGALEIGSNGEFINRSEFQYDVNVNPVVMIQDHVGIDSKGCLVLPVANGALKAEYMRNKYIECLAEINNQRLISVMSLGSLCITGSRKLVYRGKTVLKGKKTVAIAKCYNGYAALLRNGEAMFSADGKRWFTLKDQAVAIAAQGDTVAVANKNGEVFVYRSSECAIWIFSKLVYENRYISEIDIYDERLAIRFADCTFEMMNWETSKSYLGEHQTVNDSSYEHYFWFDTEEKV